jgi:hypothetical protein
MRGRITEPCLTVRDPGGPKDNRFHIGGGPNISEDTSMADRKDYRDPKVTQDSGGGGMGKWIAIAAIVLLALLALAWLIGLFDDDEVVETDPEAVIVTPEAQEGDAVISE